MKNALNALEALACVAVFAVFLAVCYLVVMLSALVWYVLWQAAGEFL